MSYPENFRLAFYFKNLNYSIDFLSFSKDNQRNYKSKNSLGLVNLGNVLESETRRLKGFSRKKVEPAHTHTAYANISRHPRYGSKVGAWHQ